MLEPKDLEMIRVIVCETVNEAKNELRSEMQSMKAELHDEIQTVKAELQEEMQTVKTELQEEMQNVKAELQEEMQTVKTELQEEMQAVKTDLQEDFRTELRRSENMILEECDRDHTYLKQKIEALQKDMNEMKEYDRITRLERDNTTTLLKIVEDLSVRVTVLEGKIA